MEVENEVNAFEIQGKDPLFRSNKIIVSGGLEKWYAANRKY